MTFTAPGQTGFAGQQLIVEADTTNRLAGAKLLKPDGARFLFDANGDLVKILDRYGNTVAIERDPSSQRILRIFDPSTDKGIDFTYDAQGHITQATGLLGQTVSYEYDPNGYLVRITDPADQSIQLAYDEQGQITAATDARGIQVLENDYTPDGFVKRQKTGDGGIIRFAYPAETIRRVTDANGHTLEYRYHASGLFAGLKTPLNQEYGTAYSAALFHSSSGARTMTHTDPLGRTSIARLNALNQPVRVTDAAGQVVTLTYEPTFKQLASITDPLAG